MPRLNRLVPLVSLSLVCLAVAAPNASGAQTLPMVRVAKETANVRTRPDAMGDVVKSADAGTNLEVIDREGDWYWVFLPPDETGTRVPGWVQVRDVEVISQGEPRTVLRHLAEANAEAEKRQQDEAAKAKAREEARAERDRQRAERERKRAEAEQARADAEAARQKAKEGAVVERARQELEKARREYEAAKQKSAAPKEPADSSAQPAGAKPSKPGGGTR